jgi:hypothetical protein
MNKPLKESASARAQTQTHMQNSAHVYTRTHASHSKRGVNTRTHNVMVLLNRNWMPFELSVTKQEGDIPIRQEYLHFW